MVILLEFPAATSSGSFQPLFHKQHYEYITTDLPFSCFNRQVSASTLSFPRDPSHALDHENHLTLGWVWVNLLRTKFPSCRSGQPCEDDDDAATDLDRRVRPLWSAGRATRRTGIQDRPWLSL